jgi:hypothetical protein
MRSVEVQEVETLDEDGLKAARGFRVYSPDGYVGVVEAVRCGSGGAATVGVRTGLFVPRTFLVPADSIARVASSRTFPPPALATCPRSAKSIPDSRNSAG